jgi:hypothetical protein
MNLNKIRKQVEELRTDAINTTPVDIDWRERLDESGEGWCAFSACECEECGAVVVGSGGEQTHGDVEFDAECEGYVNFDEPAMNYYYPIPYANLDCESAKKISGPLVLVGFDDGVWALALSGGGMDFSWEICKAFIELGYLPPVHFADLPQMAGDSWTEDRALVVLAVRRSLEIAAGWLKSKGLRLVELEKHLKESNNV